RSNWTADQNTQGEFDEIRFYDYVLTANQVAGNALAGANVINDHDVAATISAQPQSQTLPESVPVTFQVGADGSTPINFQWLRNGTAIPGATSSTYTLSSVSAADNGAKFTVEVSNTVNGSPAKVTSEAATLTVTTETATLVHRYSFSEASGDQIQDSVGTANGQAFGTFSRSGGQLVLGGTADTYVKLPNGLHTALVR